jgi:hypothetical protein
VTAARRVVGYVVVAALVIGVAAAVGIRRSEALGACEILPSADIERIAGVPGPPKPFETERAGIASTGCDFGDGEPGTYLTMFSVRRHGGAFMRSGRDMQVAHGVEITPLKGPGYDGYLSGGPREGSTSVVVVKHDHYVNILVYNAPPGTAERLADLAGRTLR